MSEDKQSEDKKELLEIYKIHTELADKIAQRREGVNSLYVILISGIFIFFATFVFVNFGFKDYYEDDLLFALQIESVTPTLFFFTLLVFLVFVVSVSWLRSVLSYHRLGEAKFHVLSKLEEELPYSFFKRESELLKKKNNRIIAWINFGIFGLVQKDTVLPYALYVVSGVSFIMFLDKLLIPIWA